MDFPVKLKLWIPDLLGVDSMGLIDGFKAIVRDAVWGGMTDDDREKYIEKRREYRRGRQKRQLEIRNGADETLP
jgi:hypothetical protein